MRRETRRRGSKAMCRERWGRGEERKRACSVTHHWFVDDSPEAWKLSLWFGCVGRDEVGWVAQPGREQV